MLQNDIFSFFKKLFISALLLLEMITYTIGYIGA
jgi:hypothetical protein